MHSAAIPSTSTAASTSSLASNITATARHHHFTHHDDTRSSVLRQHSDEEKPIKSTMQTNGLATRPASKARRTSSGGSRIPSEDVNQHRGSQTGSSASDSGSEWRHGPKSHSTAASSFPTQPSASSSALQTDAKDITDDARGIDRMPNRASTSSNYFDKAALAAAASTQADGHLGYSESSRSAHLDLAEYPAQDLLRLLAALLAQIAAANDQLRPKGVSTPLPATSAELKAKSKELSNDMTTSISNSSITSLQDGKSQASKLNGSSDQPGSNTSSPGISRRPTTAALSALQAPSSTLCFHARNIPSISIESYLLRILKYCPATNEVFLSLLIYFDRMSKMGAPPSSRIDTRGQIDSAQVIDGQSTTTSNQNEQEEKGSNRQMHAGMRGFAIDSYNVHRLVIAGVTVASKFFSDVFYTNSRYAKVRCYLTLLIYR